LLIHPDKCKHPQAEQAFSLLAKAQEAIFDEEKKKILLETVNQAREAIRRRKRLKVGEIEESPRGSELQKEVNQEVKQILVEDELRRRRTVKRIMENEGKDSLEAEKKKEEEKKQREAEKAWEESRDGRVTSWRDFQQKSTKKKPAGEFKPPKLTTSDDAKTYVRRVNNPPKKE